MINKRVRQTLSRYTVQATSDVTGQVHILCVVTWTLYTYYPVQNEMWNIVWFQPDYLVCLGFGFRHCLPKARISNQKVINS